MIGLLKLSTIRYKEWLVSKVADRGCNDFWKWFPFFVVFSWFFQLTSLYLQKKIVFHNIWYFKILWISLPEIKKSWQHQHIFHYSFKSYNDLFLLSYNHNWIYCIMPMHIHIFWKWFFINTYYLLLTFPHKNKQLIFPPFNQAIHQWKIKSQSQSQVECRIQKLTI